MIMAKQTMRLLITILFLMVALATKGQQYVVDPLFLDSVTCGAVVRKDTAWKALDYSQAIVVHRGEIIDSCGKSGKGSIVFARGKRHYRIWKSFLSWSRTNPDTLANPLSAQQQRRHSTVGHFLATPAPLWLIMGFLALAFILTLVGGHFGVKVVRQVGTVAVPLCLLAVAVIEVSLYTLFGADAFWWCDYDRYGFWKTLLRIIPFLVTVVAQVTIVWGYESLLFYDSPDEGKKIHMKPAVVGALVAMPTLVVYFLVCQMVLGWKGQAMEMTGALIFLGILLTGTAVTFRRNITELGWAKGSLISIFVIVYVVGCMVAVGAVVVALVRLFLVMLGALFALALLGGGGSKVYQDKYGNRYVQNSRGDLIRQ